MKAKAFKLTLEVNQKFIDGDKNNVLLFGKIPAMITPPLDEDYWQFRVMVNDEQAIIGFPKFGTIGIGFAKEDDWNTNLPYSYSTQTLWEHIKVNKYFASIPDERCLKAIKMVQKVATEMKQAELEADEMIILQNEPKLLSEITNKVMDIKEFKKKCKILKRNYFDTFTNSGLGTERKSKNYCMFFGYNPDTNKYRYKFDFYATTPEMAIGKFYSMVRRHCLTGSTKTESKFDILYVSNLDEAVFGVPKIW